MSENTHTTDGVPSGFTSLTPCYVVSNGARAIDFYTRVFGARLVFRFDGPDGSIWHAELDFDDGRMQLSDPTPSMGLVGPCWARPPRPRLARPDPLST